MLAVEDLRECSRSIPLTYNNTEIKCWIEPMEHLDFAITEFREMKMQPSLERALRHKEILGA